MVLFDGLAILLCCFFSTLWLFFHLWFCLTHWLIRAFGSVGKYGCSFEVILSPTTWLLIAYGSVHQLWLFSVIDFVSPYGCSEFMVLLLLVAASGLWFCPLIWLFYHPGSFNPNGCSRHLVLSFSHG